MGKPHRQRGFWAEAWPLVPGVLVASVAWAFPGHGEFGFPNSTASEVFFSIGLAWNCIYTAWALQRSASGVFRRIGMALLGLFGGVLLTEVVVFMPPMVVWVLMHSF
ncbi:MAG: hypothetical protein HUU19_07475 [Phycisphaerales bacterium]|nr:hypothetical protein [Phycisphaerales bacterium]